MKLKAIVFLIVAALLGGCAAVVAVGAATGIVVYDRRSFSAIETDGHIFYRINNAIAKDPRFLASRIVVSSYQRAVLLVGQASHASVRVLAEKIAQTTPNVRRVYDEISIGPRISFGQQNTDTWITGQVRSKLLATKGLESGSIHIVTERQVVYLMGVVTHDQANLAVYAARQVPDVHRVVKMFQYIV
jgi:osmotically-inducible protein OsmY